MEILVGVNLGSQSGDALALASALATTLDADLVVANVYPVAYNYVSPAHVDAEWQGFLLEQAEEALAWARQQLGDRDRVSYVIHPHRSSGVGLAEIATARHSQIIVIGSAPGGSSDRIHGGSTSDQLLHGSPVPVAIAPHGYRKWAPAAIARANVAYRPTHESDHCLDVTVEALIRNGFDVSATLLLFTVIVSAGTLRTKSSSRCANKPRNHWQRQSIESMNACPNRWQFRRPSLKATPSRLPCRNGIGMTLT